MNSDADGKSVEPRADNLGSPKPIVDVLKKPVVDVTQYPVGVAYKKPGSKDLWRRVGDTEINMTKLKKQSEHMQMPPGSYSVPTYSFNTRKNSGVFMPNNKSVAVTVCGLERLRIGKDATRLMNVLEFTDISTGQPTESTIGKLFKKPGDNGLWWGTADGLVDLTAGNSAPDAASGNATKPGYSFDDNPTSGVFLKSPGHVGLSVNGVERMSFKHAETVMVNPLRSSTGTAAIPSYSFVDSKTTGFYSAAANSMSIANEGSETLRINPTCIKVMSDAVMMHADGAERGPGLSFTKEPSSGLYRKASGVLAVACLSKDVLLASAKGIEIKGNMLVKAGGTTPTYGFTGHTAGMRSDDDGNVVFRVASDVMRLEAGKVSMLVPLKTTRVLIDNGEITGESSLSLAYKGVGMSITEHAVTIAKPLKLVTDDTSGSLYVKPDSDGLWWSVDGVERNLITSDSSATFPLNAPAAGYSFADTTHRMSVVNDNLVFSVDNAEVSVGVDGLTSNVPLVFTDQHVPIMSNNTSGALYKKDGNNGLYWNVNNVEFDVTKTLFPIKAQCTSVTKPTYSFTSHSGTGMYHDVKPGFSYNSVRVFDYNADRVAFDKPLELLNTVVAEVANDVGRLYKKANSSGLFWKTSGAECDLTSVMQFPTMAPNGVESNPTYAFEEDRHTGMYYSNGLVFSHNAFNRMSIDKNIHLYSDLHLHNGDAECVLSINGDKLTMTIGGATTNFGDVSYPLKAPNGGVSMPSYTFGESGSGLYHDASGVCVGVNSILSTSFTTSGLSTSIIDIKDVDQNMISPLSNSLYKCMGSEDLWWSSNGVVKNLCDTTTEFPLYASIGQVSYSFKEEGDTGMRLSEPGRLCLTVNGDDMIVVSNEDTTINSTLVVNGGIHLKNLSTDVFAFNSLHQSNNKLLWTDSLGASIDLTQSTFSGGLLASALVLTNGEQLKPSLTFAGDTDTGLRLLMPNTMSYTCGGEDRVLFTEDGLRVRSKYGFVNGNAYMSNSNNGFHIDVGGTRTMTVREDSVSVLKLELNRGILHAVGDNLMWSVNGVDKCLNEELEFPMLSPVDGDHITPSYTFESDTTTGMYLNDVGVGLTHRGKLCALFGNGSVYSKKYTMSNNHSMTVKNADVVITANANTLTIGDDVSATSFSATKYKLGECALELNDKKVTLGSSIARPLSVALCNGDVSVSVDTSVKVNGPLVINGTEVSMTDVLTTKSNGVRRTYHSSETFGVSVDVKMGDVVGIQNDGTGLISKVSGGNWSDEMKISTDALECSRVSLWDSLDVTRDVRLYTREKLVDGNSVLSLFITVFDTNNVVGNMSLILESTGVGNDSAINRTVSLCKINNGNYVVAFGTYNDMKKVTLKQFKVTYTGDVPKMLVMSELRHEMESPIETFDLVYEMSGELDILVLTMYNTMSNNIDVAMFSCLPHLQVGYTQKSISSDPIIGNNKTMQSLLLPGLIVVCSYGNTKCFLLLPSTATEQFNTSNTIIDSNSSDCIDMIYDSVNSVILSVERTYTNQAFLQVSDIDGPQINIIRSKQLGRETCVPTGLGYNPDTDNFVLFYADSSMSGQLHAQIFACYGETINLGVVYSRSNPNNLVRALTLSDDTLIPANGKRVFNRLGALCVEWESGSESSSIANFDDNFGIQATAYIGMAMNDAVSGSTCEVALRGQIFVGGDLPNSYIGKRLYLNSLGKTYPDSITTRVHGNVFLGTCLTSNRILVGL